MQTGGLVSRSDIVLRRPGTAPAQAMPLGNGVLGAAVWSAGGFTAQLNRNDLYPGLKSPGKLAIPGLSALTGAPDYSGRLALYDGSFVQTGGGMTARSFVDAHHDYLVVEVSGANPASQQTAELRLWASRSPSTFASGDTIALAETFTDPDTGRTSGAIAAATALARNVTASSVNTRTVRLTFNPNTDGTFRIVTSVPPYAGGSISAAAAAALPASARQSGNGLRTAHEGWWHDFWAGTNPFKITSADGTGEYQENLRALALYTSAASMRGDLPSSHGAVANLFSAFEDHHDWSPAHFWHFNLRMLVSANFGAGAEEFNAPYHELYLDHANEMRTWTQSHIPGSQGLCAAEILRYDGANTYPGMDQCVVGTSPSWTTRILSTGPEVAMNLWRHYRATRDETFLDRAYPFIADVARFYLSFAQLGGDGKLHLNNVNALETQWATNDPANDLAAMKVLFPLVADLAAARGDSALASQLTAAIPKIPDFRIVTRNGEQVIAWSATDESSKNFQNVELETVWPWGLFGDDNGAGAQLARASFRQRVFVQPYDWAMDATWAARLGLHADVKSLLNQGAANFQAYANGFSHYIPGTVAPANGSFYQEWNYAAATGLHEALVQSYDGVIRVGPAWPTGWEVDGSVQTEAGHRVTTQVRDDTVEYAALAAARADTVTIRNPWPGQQVRVVDGVNLATQVVAPTTAATIQFSVAAGQSYVLERTARPVSAMPFATVGGTAATQPKHLGSRTLGIDPPVQIEGCDPGSATDAPLLHWDPTSGNDVCDASGYALHGEVNGGGAYAAGPSGPALAMNGTRFVRSYDVPTWGDTAAMTFYAQIRVDSAGTYRRLWDAIPVGGTDGFLVDLTPTNEVRFIGGGAVTTTGTTVPQGTWQRLAVTRDAAGSLKVYLNGQLQSTTTVASDVLRAGPGLRVTFGAAQDGGNRFVGAVDNMRLYGRALPQGEIAALDIAPAPIVDWNPVTGNTIADGSGTGLHADVVGGGAYATGPHGRSLTLDGSRYVRSQQTPGSGNLAAITLHAQVRAEGSGVYRRLWDIITPGGTDGVMVDLTPANEIRFIGGGTVTVTGATLPTGTWVDLAVTRNAAGTLTVYLDGSPAWSGSAGSNPLQTSPPNLRLQFGAAQNGANVLTGGVDRMRMWNVALSAAAIASLS